MKYLNLALGAIFLVVILKILNKFNLFGTSKASEEAKKLGEDATLNQPATNIANDNKNIFGIAIKKRFGNKPTKAQILSLLPHVKLTGQFINSINSAHNNFTPNDASKIFNVFKLMVSQFEVNFFSTNYGITTGKDLYGELDRLMKDSDMEKLRAIINSKPII